MLPGQLSSLTLHLKLSIRRKKNCASDGTMCFVGGRTSQRPLQCKDFGECASSSVPLWNE
jgi:hypothetical protein